MQQEAASTAVSFFSGWSGGRPKLVLGTQSTHLSQPVGDTLNLPRATFCRWQCDVRIINTRANDRPSSQKEPLQHRAGQNRKKLYEPHRHHQVGKRQIGVIKTMNGLRSPVTTASSLLLAVAILYAGSIQLTQGRNWAAVSSPSLHRTTTSRTGLFGLSKTVSAFPRGGSDESAEDGEKEEVLYLPGLLDAAIVLSEQVSVEFRLSRSHLSFDFVIARETH